MTTNHPEKMSIEFLDGYRKAMSDMRNFLTDSQFFEVEHTQLIRKIQDQSAIFEDFVTQAYHDAIQKPLELND